MEELYATLSAWTDETRQSVWRRWLWESDCNAKPLEQCCDMNLMHTLGLLCCLGEARAPPLPLFASPIGPDTLPHAEMVHLHPDVPIAALTLRQLLDQLECLQLNWGPVVSKLCPDETPLLRALMARLGELAQRAFREKDGVLDDPQHCTPLPQPATQDSMLLVISRKSLRQAICVFFGLTRVQEVLRRCEAVPEPSPQEHNHVVGALRQHHVEAAGDLFSELQQMVHLAPGMRLVYRTNFAGMYNHVSQVVYFHYPRFARKPPMELRKIPTSGLHMLPLIMQLLPDVPIVYDDDSVVPGLMPSPPDTTAPWVWLVCCGAFFLVDTRRERVFAAQTLTPLVAHYLRCTARTLSASDEGTGAFVRGEACAPHAHIVLPPE